MRNVTVRQYGRGLKENQSMATCNYSFIAEGHHYRFFSVGVGETILSCTVTSQLDQIMILFTSPQNHVVAEWSC